MTALRRQLRMMCYLWWLHTKMASRSAFDSLLAVLYPMFFATTVLLIYRSVHEDQRALLGAVVGSATMSVWSATSTRAAFLLQTERRQGTLELMVAAPSSFALVLFPLTLSMATIGLAGIVTTLAWGRVVFGVTLSLAHPALFVVGIVVTVFAVGMLGFLLSVGSVRYKTAWALGAAVELPVWLICGFLVPLTALPVWVRPISWALAPTWGMDAVREGSTGGGGGVLDLGVALAEVAAYAVIGMVLARWVLRTARVNATLAIA